MDYIIHLAVFFLLFSINNLSLNLVVGYTGLLSLGIAIFSGVGAYTTAILTSGFGFNFFITVFLGIIFAGVIGFAIAVILSRLNGDYYLLGTVGFAYIFVSVLFNWEGLTGGARGVSSIPRPIIFGLSFDSNFSFFLLCLIFFSAALLLSFFVVNSSFGRVLKAIREDEKAVQVFGYNTFYFKIAVFVMSAVIAAVAGSLYSSYVSYIDPTVFVLTEAVFILTRIIFGGLGSISGSLIGAIFFVLMPEALRFLGFPSGIAGQMRQLIYGLILIVLMLYRPQGLVGKYKL